MAGTGGIWRRGAAFGGLGLAFAGSAAWSMQRRLIYYPDALPIPPAASVVSSAEDVQFTTDDGLTLRAWYVRPSSGAADRNVTVLMAHGNAGSRADRAPLAAKLARRGIATLLLDYRGYGGNPGQPSEQGLALDVRAAYWYLRKNRGVEPERMIYFGESLGCGVVAELALRYPPGGVVLRSPFTDLVEVGKLHYPRLPVQFFLRDRFRVVDAVRKITVPIVVVYGTSDDIVPAEMSAKVADAAKNLNSTVVLPGVGHNDPHMLVGGELISAVEGLIPD
ncbi:alpha/beta hydrolase [Hoyosella sp. YIM 151337]|uniref:alpha/beta hydrolase n=1 Tax=Hoyosella sp. YIM 151337 TaxID=2992742 RepID=UPI00223619CF|nr:alpha/beta hydrolase [Hoyosella sp. YIM 151337]MCW4353739.1 alpha/beta hydrolase [Hoyosella sp. YIM 151337]